MKWLKRLNEGTIFIRCESGRALPVLLLILFLLAGGGYLYFCTDLITKHDQANTPLAPNASLVKKPLPPHSENPAAVTEKKSAVTSQEAKVESKAKTGAGRPAPVKPSEQKRLPAAKTATKQAAVQTSSEEKLVKLTTGKQVAKTGPESKHAVTAEQNKKAKEPEKKQGEVKQEKPSVEPGTVPEKGKYTLLIGVYVMKKSMSPEKTKLKSAGLKPEIRKGPKRMEPMNRLLIGRFDSYAEASLESKKLAKATNDTFILPEKDKFSVYAGSYFEKGRAISERERLEKAGLRSEIVQTSVPVNTFRLTAGSFASKELAVREAKRLKKLGLAATVATSGI